MGTQYTFAEPSDHWMLLSRVLTTVPFFQAMAERSMEQEFAYAPELSPRCWFEDNWFLGCLRAEAGDAKLIYQGRGNLVVYSPPEAPPSYAEGFLKESFYAAITNIEHYLKTKAVERSIRFYGRPESLEKPFEIIPSDWFLSGELSIDITANSLSLAGTLNYLHVHVELGETAVDVWALAGGETSDGERKSSQRDQVATLVATMVEAAPSNILRKIAAERLGMSAKSRRFEKIWASAIVQFEALDIITAVKYGQPGRPKKSPQAENVAES